MISGTILLSISASHVPAAWIPRKNQAYLPQSKAEPETGFLHQISDIDDGFHDDAGLDRGNISFTSARPNPFAGESAPWVNSSGW
jgi:hypothetical protein